MGVQPQPGKAKEKPCICSIFPEAGWLHKATGHQDAQGHDEVTCKLCGKVTVKKS